MIIVAAAIIPTRTSLIIGTIPRFNVTCLFPLSPIIAIPTTSAKNSNPASICPKDNLCDFTFVTTGGNPPTINPINNKFVGIG